MKELVLLFVFPLMMMLSGCSENYGESIDRSLPRITVIKALTDRTLMSKEINMEGSILAQCEMTGCWFFLQDETGRILVDLAPSHFTIPSKTGKKVFVSGKLSEEGGSVKLIGKAVEIF
jgi:hypothetical protein